MWCMWDVRREERNATQLRKCLTCVLCVLCSVFQLLPVALTAQASLEQKKKRKNKAQEHCPSLFSLTMSATVAQEAL